MNREYDKTEEYRLAKEIDKYILTYAWSKEDEDKIKGLVEAKDYLLELAVNS